MRDLSEAERAVDGLRKRILFLEIVVTVLVLTVLIQSIKAL